jgi:hypothetical protein
MSRNVQYSLPRGNPTVFDGSYDPLLWNVNPTTNVPDPKVNQAPVQPPSNDIFDWIRGFFSGNTGIIILIVILAMLIISVVDVRDKVKEVNDSKYSGPSDQTVAHLLQANNLEMAKAQSEAQDQTLRHLKNIPNATATQCFQVYRNICNEAMQQMPNIDEQVRRTLLTDHIDDLDSEGRTHPKISVGR